MDYTGPNQDWLNLHKMLPLNVIITQIKRILAVDNYCRFRDFTPPIAVLRITAIFGVIPQDSVLTHHSMNMIVFITLMAR